MSNYDFLKPRNRKKSLFIVEGDHEKDVLVHLLLKAFQEIDIAEEDVVIFHSNIYSLYDAIEEEYGEAWDEIGVDLVYLMNKQGRYESDFEDVNFNNIVLMFDYERQDPKFSEEKLCRLQSYFSDSTDEGKLFLNYPMVEAYRDFAGWPDASFEYTEVTSKLQTGQEYKSRVMNTMVAKMVDLPDTLESTLENRYHMSKTEKRIKCAKELLQLRPEEATVETLASVLSQFMSEEKVMTAKYQMRSLLESSEHWKEGCTYYEYMRCLFCEIVKHNICKARSIVGKPYQVDASVLYDEYFHLSLLEVLERQNELSRDKQQGVIKILNTGVFFVADYRISLIGVGR